MAENKINHEKFVRALPGTGGVQSDIAAKLGVTRGRVTQFLDQFPEMRDMLNQERQKLIDVAENVYKEALSLQTKDTPKKTLPERVKRDNMRLKLKAAEKVVTTLGKNRGWIPKEEREMSGSVDHTFGPLKINVNMPKISAKELKPQAPKIRIAIAGIPKAGKTTLSEEMKKSFTNCPSLQLLHTDDIVKKFDWSGASKEVSTWFNKAEFIIEGSVVPRALREWMKENTGKPCDKLIWLHEPYEELSQSQKVIAKGCLTVMKEIRLDLINRGVKIVENVKKKEAQKPIIKEGESQEEKKVATTEPAKKET